MQILQSAGDRVTTVVTEDAFSGQDYFPEKMGRRRFYDPAGRGYESEVRRRLERWAELREGRRGRGEA